MPNFENEKDVATTTSNSESTAGVLEERSSALEEAPPATAQQFNVNMRNTDEEDRILDPTRRNFISATAPNIYIPLILILHNISAKFYYWVVIRHCVIGPIN